MEGETQDDVNQNNTGQVRSPKNKKPVVVDVMRRLSSLSIDRAQETAQNQGAVHSKNNAPQSNEESARKRKRGGKAGTQKRKRDGNAEAQNEGDVVKISDDDSPEIQADASASSKKRVKTKAPATLGGQAMDDPYLRENEVTWVRHYQAEFEEHFDKPLTHLVAFTSQHLGTTAGNSDASEYKQVVEYQKELDAFAKEWVSENNQRYGKLKDMLRRFGLIPFDATSPTTKQ